MFVGVDVGGTKVLAVVAEGDGTVLAEHTQATPSRDAEAVADAMAGAAKQAVAKAGARLDQVQSAGLAVAGIVDVTRGVVVHSPNLRAVDGANLLEMFRKRLDVPTVIGNDANLAALAEHRFGAGKGFSPLIYITISTGVGGGIILNDRMFTGAQGFAGEVGHMSVDAHGPYGMSSVPGAWEALVSGTALARIAAERIQAGASSSLSKLVGDGDALDARAVFGAFRAGDELARSVIEEGRHYLGVGLASLVNILNPAKILIGGGLSNEWDDYIEPGVQLMRRYALGGMGEGVPVEPASLGAGVGALGAIALAAEVS